LLFCFGTPLRLFLQMLIKSKESFVSSRQQKKVVQKFHSSSIKWVCIKLPQKLFQARNKHACIRTELLHLFSFLIICFSSKVLFSSSLAVIIISYLRIKNVRNICIMSILKWSFPSIMALCSSRRLLEFFYGGVKSRKSLIFVLKHSAIYTNRSFLSSLWGQDYSEIVYGSPTTLKDAAEIVNRLPIASHCWLQSQVKMVQTHRNTCLLAGYSNDLQIPSNIRCIPYFGKMFVHMEIDFVWNSK